MTVPSGFSVAVPFPGWPTDVTVRASPSGSESLARGVTVPVPFSGTDRVSSSTTGEASTRTPAVGPVEAATKSVPDAPAVLSQVPGVGPAVAWKITVRSWPTGTLYAPDQVRCWPLMDGSTAPSDPAVDPAT